MADESPNLHFDHVLDHFVGAAGPWQWGQFAFILLFNLVNDLPLMIHIFSAFTPEHRCRVDICEGDQRPDQIHQDWTSFAIPPNMAKESFLKEDQNMSKCHMYKTVEGAIACTADSFLNNMTVDCISYTYDRSIFKETLTTELDLVCYEDYKKGLIGTTLMIGLTIGGLIGGPLGDKLGRRKTILMAISVMGPVVAIEGFIPIYPVFITLRLIVFTCISIQWIAGHALLLELFGKQHHRKLAYVINSLFFGVKGALLSLLAYLERNWKFLHLWNGLVIMAVTPILYVYLKESMRWLVLNGREAEAEKMLLKVAKANKRHLSSTQAREMNEALKNMANAADKAQESRLSALDMFRGTYISTTLIALIVWISCIVTYYTLALNVTDLAGNMFVNNAVSGLVEVPATFYVWFALDRLGRRNCMMTPQVILCICCIIMAYLPKIESFEMVMLLLFLLARLSATCAVNTIWFYTAELYPTNLRVQAVGICSLVARVFGASSPFIANLSGIWEPLPNLVLGFTALVSGALVVFLPETKGQELKEMAKEEEMTKAVAVDDKMKTGDDGMEEIPL